MPRFDRDFGVGITGKKVPSERWRGEQGGLDRTEKDPRKLERSM
jgi:hypothetical protein